MFADQLKVFFVGGPNTRKDYHLEEGEEVFYQIQGDMVLKVIEQGKPKDIKICQGEIFLLPGRIEHSPQRFANTVGCVIERTRDNDELDCVRYFVDGTTDVLFERWFHLNDVVADLPPVIREFNESEEAKTGKPGSKSFLREPAYKPDSKALPDPINLADFIDKNLDRIKAGPVQLYGIPEYKTSVRLFGKGRHTLESGNGELIIMPQRGHASVQCGKEYQLSAFDICRVKENKTLELTVDDDSIVLFVKMVRNPN